MFSAKRITLISVAALAALSWTDSLIAAEPSVSSSSPGVVATPSTVSSSSVPSPPASVVAIVAPNPFGSSPLTLDALASKRGGDGVVFNDMQLKGVVANNSASNLTTGSNAISDGAFAGSAGLSTVIQNSGNNVLIQNATIVNLQLK